MTEKTTNNGSQNTTQKTKDSVTRTKLKTGDLREIHLKVSGSFSTSGTSHVTRVKNLAHCHERGTATNGSYMWSSVKQIFCNS